MRFLIRMIWAAVVIQAAIIVANFSLPKKLDCRETPARVSPMIREIFIVHWIYIVLVLGVFSALCCWFTPELAGASPLGRFLSAMMALFWLLRIPVKLFSYDPGLRRRHRVFDASFLLALSVLVLVFGASAIGGMR